MDDLLLAMEELSEDDTADSGDDADPKKLLEDLQKRYFCINIMNTFKTIVY